MAAASPRRPARPHRPSAGLWTWAARAYTIEVPLGTTPSGIDLDISAAVANGDFTKTGAGGLQLDGSSDNTALTIAVEAGTVVFAKASSDTVHAAATVTDIAMNATVRLAGSGAGQIGEAASQGVTMSGGTLDLDGESLGVDVFAGTGVVTNMLAGTTAVLTVGAGNSNSNFAGFIQDDSSGRVARSRPASGR